MDLNLTSQEVNDVINALEAQANTFKFREERHGEGYDGDIARKLYDLIVNIKKQAGIITENKF